MSSLESHIDLIEQRIAGLPFPLGPTGLYEPLRYTLALGGKRLRPALALAACELEGGRAELALDAAVGIELFHNFTLLHDDIMDAAPLRRGQPAVHAKFGQNTAILSGDVMLVWAYRLVSGVPDGVLAPVLARFSKTAEQVCIGQQHDMDFESRDDVSVDEYLEMIRLKTAVLLGCSLAVGALTGGGSAADADRLHAFGCEMGLAFQLQDDLLDSFGDPAVFGKAVGGDILRNKKTFLLIRALESAPDTLRNELLEWLRRSPLEGSPEGDEKVVAVKAIYQKAGIREEAEKRVQERYAQAIGDLDAVQAPEAAKAPLRKIAAFLLGRRQ